MRCEEFELVLQRQFDGESVEMPDLLQDHASNCEACRELQEGMRILTRAFACDRVPPVAPDLTDRIHAAALGNTARNSLRRRPRAIGWLAAAAILGAAGLGLRSLLTLPPNSMGTIANQPMIEVPATPEDVLFPELSGPNAADSRNAVPIVYAFEPVSRLFQDVGRSLGGPVRPIAESTSEAMSNLIRDLPDTEDSLISIPLMRDRMGPTPGKKMPGMMPSS